MSGKTFLGVDTILCALTHSTLELVLRDNYYFPHFTDEEIEAKLLKLLSKVITL